MDGEVIQHLPILRENVGPLVRGRVQIDCSTMTTTCRAILLPVLGSGRTLRGYSTGASAIGTPVDVGGVPVDPEPPGPRHALFYDAGKVASR